MTARDGDNRGPRGAPTAPGAPVGARTRPGELNESRDVTIAVTGSPGVGQLTRPGRTARRGGGVTLFLRCVIADV